MPTQQNCELWDCGLICGQVLRRDISPYRLIDVYRSGCQVGAELEYFLVDAGDRHHLFVVVPALLHRGTEGTGYYQVLCSIFIMAVHNAVFLPLALLVALHSASTSARFAHTYGSHMVLQKAPQRAVVWGYYTSGTVDHVKLTLDGVPVPVFEGQEQGTWMAKLPATSASNKPHTLELSENNATTTLNDVLFGDVWVCSGQSNMAFLLQNAFNGSALVKESMNYPNLRVFTSFKNNSPRPLAEQPHVQERWSRSSPAAVSQATHRLLLPVRVVRSGRTCSEWRGAGLTTESTKLSRKLGN